MSDPNTTNPDADLANKIIRQINSAGVQLLITIIIADVPWLGAWPLKPIMSWVLGWLDGYLSIVEQTGTTFVIIDQQIGNEQAAISRAIAAIDAAQKSGDKNALKQALKDYADAQSALVHDDGSATPTK